MNVRRLFLLSAGFAGWFVFTCLLAGAQEVNPPAPAATSAPAPAVPAVSAAPRIQIAILLDTSNSMDGLIAQAKQELWAIVNQFIGATQNGKAPELEVALFQYGNDSLPAEEGYIRLVAPLTNDLDLVSERLFALTTNGGSEFCGQVIQVATRTLQWSGNPEDLKTIFIAGNEPFTQGPVDFREACKEALAKGILINTIHCGAEKVGVDTGWKDGAVLGEGQFLAIDQNAMVAYVEAPQDEEIAKLGTQLNSTYLAFGAEGTVAAGRQVMQDSNALGVNLSVAASRAVSKSSEFYLNASWDLVDAQKAGNIKLEEIPAGDLPEVMRNLKPEERAAFVEKMAAERAELQKRIQALNTAREQFIAAEMKKLTAENGSTLGEAIQTATLKLANQRNFQLRQVR